MTEMRLAIDVINRGGDEKPFAHRVGSFADKRGEGNAALSWFKFCPAHDVNRFLKPWVFWSWALDNHHFCKY